MIARLPVSRGSRSAPLISASEFDDEKSEERRNAYAE